MIIVNIAGAPSSGKSTCANYVAAKLKMRRINVELVTEFAKEKTWEKNELAMDNQFYMSGVQSYRLSSLKDSVDVVVTDSPLFLGIMYNRNPQRKALNDAIMEEFYMYQNMTFFLTRVEPYDPTGRWQTEAEADAVSDRLRQFMMDKKIHFTDYRGTEEDYQKIADEVIEICEKLNLCK